MLLLKHKENKRNKITRKAREKSEKENAFADQDAIFWSTTKKKILPRIYNEQSKFNKKRYSPMSLPAKRLMFFPYPHTENYKQWNIEEVHKVLNATLLMKT